MPEERSPTEGPRKVVSTRMSPEIRVRPLLSDHAGQSVRRGVTRKRVSQDTERLRKSRKAIDHHLRRMGTGLGKELSLNQDGLCYFPSKRFIIAVEVPEDNPGVCLIYTMVSRLSAGDNVMEVMRLAMELNYMQTGTRGATLGLERDEVNLCFSIPVVGISLIDLRNVLEDFTETAAEMNERLEAVKRLPALRESPPRA